MSEAPVRAPMVTVRGEGHREVEPDLATVSVLLHAAGGAAGAVRSKLAAGSSRLAAALQDFAAAVESSSTGGLHIAPEFDRRAPSRIRGYRGTFRTSVVLHYFAVLPDLVLAVVGLEDSHLYLPWWSLRSDN